MPSLNDPFSLMFKNMGSETIVQICHIIQHDFAALFVRNGIIRPLQVGILYARFVMAASARPAKNQAITKSKKPTKV